MIDRGIVALLVGAGVLTACDRSGPEDEVSALPATPPSATPPSAAATPGAPSSAAPSPPVSTEGTAARPVLRWRQSGGIAGTGGPGSVPDFSLYADGRALYVSKADAASPASGLREARLKPEALARLLGEARAAGIDRSRTLGSGRIPDAITVEITMGGARTSIVQPEARTEQAARFWKRLAPDAWSRADLAVPTRQYSPERLAVLAGPAAPAGDQKVRDWTLPPLAKGERAAGGLCTVLAGHDAKALLEPGGTPAGGSLWRSQGQVYSLRLRPMLPGETACADLARP